MNYYLNNRNIVPAGGGRGFGGRIFGGIADSMRMQTGAVLGDWLHANKTARELEADKALESHRHELGRTTAEHLTGEMDKREKSRGRQSRLTIGKQARENRKTASDTRAGDIEHMVNITAATMKKPGEEGYINPDVILSAPGGTRFQARGQGFRPPKADPQG